MALNAGELRHKLELQEDVGGDKDSRGREAENWKTKAILSAAWDQTGSQEAVRFQQQYPTSTGIWKTRWHSQVEPTPAWRLKHCQTGEIYEIIGLDNRQMLNTEWWFAVSKQVLVRDGDV